MTSFFGPSTGTTPAASSGLGLQLQQQQQPSQSQFGQQTFAPQQFQQQQPNQFQQQQPNQFQQQQPSQFQQQQPNQIQPQQQQQAIQSLQDILQNATALTSAVSGPELFGDNRDEVVSHLNQLLAAVGVGKGYFRPPDIAFPFSSSNIFYRFRGVGYNRLSKYKNADGMVSLVLNNAPTKFQTNADKIKFMDSINAILRASKQPAGSLMLGSIQQQQTQTRSNISVEIKSIIPLDEQHTEIVIIAKEYGGVSGRGLLPATDLYNELSQKINELRQQLGCEKIVPRIELEKADLENYLRRPPPGFEEIWAQAIRGNPDPERLIPYPIQGFQQLLQRKKQQIALIDSLHNGFDDHVSRLSNVQSELLTTRSRYSKIVQNQKQLSNRILNVLTTQTQNQRHGQIVDDKEEQLQCRLESINVLLNGPGKLKDEIAAIYDTVRRDNEKWRQTMRERSARTGQHISQQDMAEVRRCLSTRQQMLENLVQTVKDSTEILKIVEQHRSGNQ